MATTVSSHLRLFIGILLFSSLFLSAQEDPQPSPLVSEPAVAPATGKEIPEALEDWVDWATWDVSQVPAFFNDEKKRVKTWSSGLAFSVTDQGGSFTQQVTVFEQAWVTLPGDKEVWALSVTANGEEKPVMSQNGVPCILLDEGSWEVKGRFQWEEMPQTVLLPRSIGILSLTRSGTAVPNPSWDAAGKLWLKRTTKEAADKNFLEVQVYRNLADGSPMWLYTDVELTVTGKSREEELGAILPEGWKLSSVDSPIPCAVDDKGRLKTQVRAGRWVISLTAFRTTPAETMQYAEGLTPVVAEELISLQNQPTFRLIEFSKVLAVDVAQTTFPEKWRQYPVHLWENEKGFEIIEKMRGMGETKPPGVNISRSFWLDDDGKELTYRDVINGSSLQTWRLDAAEGQRLGAAKIGTASQLITKNPANGAVGVEVRTRNLNLQSVGRMDNASEIPATGWQCNAEILNGTLYLPPGWRALAILGADSSSGDWLTSWSLLDVFLLLLLTVACFRLFGWKVSLVAFLAFFLSYHERGTPKMVWVFLLVMICLFNALPVGKWRRMAQGGCYLAVIGVLLSLVPFSLKQIQQALYPQLESHSVVGTRDYQRELSVPIAMDAAPAPSRMYVEPSLEEMESSLRSSSGKKSAKGKGYFKKNMLQDSKAKIQTGPAVPEWSWRSVSFGWSGPVSANEKVSFILIPRWLQQLITVSRVLLLFGFLYGLLHQLRGKPPIDDLPDISTLRKSGPIAVLLLLSSVLFIPSVHGQVPDAETLETLKKRVMEEPPRVSQFAEIPEVNLFLEGREMKMEVNVHVAKQTAVPLPGKLTVWSPLSVTSGSGEPLALSRHAGHLWVVLEEGTHLLEVKGIVPAGDWEWAFLLKPQYVNINAPNWTHTGVETNGIPEDQVFFVEKNRSQNEEAAYDRKDFNPVFKVNRNLEMGLEWEAETSVRRLSPLGKAVSLSLPLLPGERILTPGFNADNGRLEIRLGAQQEMVSWSSQLAQNPEILLKAEPTEQWVEEWRVVTSPVWNIALNGINPVFQRDSAEMVPIWKPWGNDEVTLKVARPEGIEGETLTIRQAIHRMNLGNRQRTSSLKLSLQNSLGMDFILGMKKEAEVSSLKLNGKESPVRREGEQVIIPLRPGEQVIELKWKTPSSLAYVSLGDEVKLPVDCANTSTVMELSSHKRWVLWTDGPLRGPAVRMWPILIAIIGIGIMLGRLKCSPLKSVEWGLLLIGLTQVHYYCSFVIVGWLLWVALKKESWLQKLPNFAYNINQLIIVGGLLPVVLILLYALHTGLLGAPEMRIIGENSSAGYLKWFQARGEGNMLPVPKVYSVSIWFYRGLMLLWAVWLAFAVIKWAKWGWDTFTDSGFFKIKKKSATPPPLPPEDDPIERKTD